MQYRIKHSKVLRKHFIFLSAKISELRSFLLFKRTFFYYFESICLKQSGITTRKFMLKKV